jgi:hypothetical protein
VLSAVFALFATGCEQAAAPPKPVQPRESLTPAASQVAKPAGPHGGVNLKVLVVSDGTPAVEAIAQQVSDEGIPETVIKVHSASRRRITTGFLTRTLRGGVKGGNFDGVVVPTDTPAGLSRHEQAALAHYERVFGVRQVDAYSPPHPDLGMNAPVFSGTLTGTGVVTPAGSKAGFGYLRRAFPFGGGPAGPAPFGYLAHALPGQRRSVTPLVNIKVPGTGRRGATLVWQYNRNGRQRLGIGFGYAYFQAQFHYLGHGIVDWLTRGVNLGDWRNYLGIAYDDMFLGDAQWSTTHHCTPGVNCPPGTPGTPTIQMNPADVTYAVQWERQHHFRMEFLYNGGATARFLVHGVDPLVTAFRPVARDFYWVNHTYTHAYLGCKQDFSVVPWRCVTAGGHLVWAAGTGLINSQIDKNFAWAGRNGIPAEPGVVASGEYSGIKLLPQQPVDNPYLVNAMGPDHIKWIVLDASREPGMRPVGAALGVPRHPIDVGFDVSTVASEVNEFNWFNTSKKDGGSGICEGSTTTRCIQPLNLQTGWASTIVPEQVKIVFNAMLDNDPRPFFMHQSNLTADRLGYPVMDGVLSAYRAVYGPSAPVTNLPTSGDGVVLRDQQLWAQALRAGAVSAWVDGKTVTISGPPGLPVPVTVPAGTRVGSASGALFGSHYATEQSAYTTLGPHPLRLALGTAPFLPVHAKRHHGRHRHIR